VTDADQSSHEGVLINEALGGDARILDWQRANSSIVNAVEIERNVMFPDPGADHRRRGVQLISGMIMMVKDKGRDIAILRDDGAPHAGRSLGSFKRRQAAARGPRRAGTLFGFSAPAS